MRIFVASVAVLVAASALAVQRPISDYKIILDRHPFGPQPEGFDRKGDPKAPLASASSAEPGEAEAEVQLSQQQAELKKTVTASVIHIDPISRTPRIGFSEAVDPKMPARSYYVAEKESAAGWFVESIDVEKGTALLKKGEVEIEVEVSASKSAPAAKPGDVKAAAAPAVADRSMPSRDPRLMPTSTGVGSSTRMSRFRERQMREQASRDHERMQVDARIKELEDRSKALEADRRRREEESRAAEAQNAQILQERIAELERRSLEPTGVQVVEGAEQ